MSSIVKINSFVSLSLPSSSLRICCLNYVSFQRKKQFLPEIKISLKSCLGERGKYYNLTFGSLLLYCLCWCQRPGGVTVPQR